MAGNKIRGITVEIAGDTSKLSKSLRDVDTSLRNTQNQLKDVNKLLKIDPKNTELLKQKQDLLNKSIEESKTKVEKLKQVQKDLGSRTSDNAKQYDAIKREIIACESQQKKWTSEVDTLTSKAAQVKQKFTEISKESAVIGEKFKKVGEGISGVGTKMTGAVTAPILGFFTLAANGASDLEENLNKVDVAFGDDAKTVKDWANTATEQFGLSKNAALEATSLFGDMGTAMGLTTGDAATMSTNLAGLAGDLSSFKNIDIEQAMNALKGVFTGETESLKGLGIIMNQTNLKQFAEDSGLVYDKLSQAELVTLRYNYVLENTKNAQGDYARTSDGTANSVRTLQATFSNLTAELGSALLPIITPIVQAITEWAKKFSELDEGTKNTIVQVGLIVAAIGPFLTVIGTLISTIGTVITMGSTIAGVIAALSGPIGIAVAAVAGLTAAGVALYMNWDTVSQWAATMVANVIVAFNTLKDDATTAIETLKSTVSGVFETIRSTISEKIEDAKSIVTSAVETIKGAFNFSWSLPPLKLPHFHVSGGEPPWGLMGKGTLPQISIDWYKRAYQNALMFNSPTVVPTSTGLLGFGDGNGAETVIGNDLLASMIRTNSGADELVRIEALLETLVQNPIVLQGDARRMFKVVRTQNTNFKTATGKSGFNY